MKAGERKPIWFSRGAVLRALLPLVLLAVPITSCTKISNAVRAPSSTVYLGDPVGGGDSGSFRLTGVVTDPVLGNSVYSMLGQNNEFELYCGGSFGACKCRYTFEQGALGTQIIEVASTHQESNMIRCPNSVPTGVASFEAMIFTSGGDTGQAFESNSLTVSLGAGAGGGGGQVSVQYLDTRDELSYAQVRRYQCKKSEFIASPFDSTFLDPIQSQDPRVIYPFNYYTSNVAESILALQRNSSAQGWECTLTPTLDHRTHWWANPMVFSAAPCSSPFCIGDGELMYPADAIESGRIPVSAGSTANGKRRSSFALLKGPYGVFNVPVVAATAPKDYVSAWYSLESVAPDLTLGALGYAARPIPTQGGSSACPAVPIPTNARWVKLWNFRATDLTPPKKVTGTSDSISSPIACWTRRGNGVFDSCEYSQHSISGSGPNLSDVDGSGNFLYTLEHLAAGQFAGRVALTAATGNGRDPSACYKVDPALPDLLQPSWYAFSGLSVQDMQAKPWGLYAGITAIESRVDALGTPVPNVSPTPAQVLNGSTLNAGTPSDEVLPGQTAGIANDNLVDQIFIVTDPQVQDSSMRNGSPPAEFQPVTYRSKAGCPGNSRSNCPVSGHEGTMVNWGVHTGQVNQPAGADTYPLCVLQFLD